MTTTTILSLGTYRNERPYPFCPGCGHGSILDAFDRALVSLGADPSRVVVVSDIGCSGLSDQYFATSAFHGLHGRSITYATGIKLARPDLDVVVIMGDGGTGIGGAHLINAARRNVGITVLVFNNLNFGMTGGQHSTTTPLGAFTATTPGGNLERPLDICATAGVNGAGFVYRGTSFDDDLGDRIAEAMRSGAFALLDIWELCTAYYVKSNRFSRRGIDQTLEDLEFATGVLYRREVPEYASAYRKAHAGDTARPEPEVLEPAFTAALDRPFHLVVAGAAGGRVRTAARLVARAAILSGLWAAQRDDYPVTVKSGHSISEVVLAPEPIDHTGVAVPDLLVVVAPEGLVAVSASVRAMTAQGRVVALAGIVPADSPAPVTVLDPASAPTRIARADHALAALVAAMRGVLPDAAIDAAVALEPAGRQQAIRAVVDAGRRLAG
jgi:2-oxoglutarate/2-oxoacid ferredoxin oxidoreductase subunit beta